MLLNNYNGETYKKTYIVLFPKPICCKFENFCTIFISQFFISKFLASSLIAREYSIN